MSERRNIALKVSPESYRQIEELAKALHISKSAVITQAVARWHHDEPLLQKKLNDKERSNNAGDNARLHSR